MLYAQTGIMTICPKEVVYPKVCILSLEPVHDISQDDPVGCTILSAVFVLILVRFFVCLFLFFFNSCILLIKYFKSDQCSWLPLPHTKWQCISAILNICCTGNFQLIVRWSFQIRQHVEKAYMGKNYYRFN